jgi:hypothetical protein
MKARIATLAAALCVGITTVAAAQGTEPQQVRAKDAVAAEWAECSSGHHLDGCAERSGQDDS